jgi:hypothetical protein
MALQSGMVRVRAGSSGRPATIRSQYVAALVAVFVFAGLGLFAVPATTSSASTSGTTDTTVCDEFDMNGVPNCDGSSDDYVDCFATSLPSCDPFIGIGIGSDGDGGFLADDGTKRHPCFGEIVRVERILSTVQFVDLDGPNETGTCPNTRRQVSAQGAMGRAKCPHPTQIKADDTLKTRHRMEFSRKDLDNTNGPDLASCVQLDSRGIATEVLFKAKITYNSTDGATATRL